MGSKARKVTLEQLRQELLILRTDILLYQMGVTDTLERRFLDDISNNLLSVQSQLQDCAIRNEHLKEQTTTPEEPFT